MDANGYDDKYKEHPLEHGRDPFRSSRGVSGGRRAGVTYESAISSAWPAVASVGRAELRRLRLPPDVVEDLLQDAAAVVMRRRPAFTTSDDLAPYVRIVVRRLGYRWWRNQARETVGGVPERPLLHSVAEVAEHRLRLRGTAMAFSSLSPQQRERFREYLVAEGRTGSAREQARERKQIERIRVTMSRIAEGFAAAVGWVRGKLRWFEMSATQAAAGVACVLTGVVAFIAPFTATGGQSAGAATAQSVARYAGAQSVLPVSTVGVAHGGADVSGGARRPSPEVVHSTPEPSQAAEVISIEMPTGGSTSWRTTDSPNNGDLLACVPTICVNYSDLPVDVPHNGGLLPR